MAKAPAFQFYVKDFLADAELQQCSASTRGIWINALCYMWQATERGRISGIKENMARLLNCTVPEFDSFLQEANVTKFADVTISNSDVTIENRRMLREDKVRINTRLRVEKHRSNKASNTNVTHTSPTASPIAVHNVVSNNIPFAVIIGYLNEVTGKNFRDGTNATKGYIKARWNEGFRLDDFKSVIDNKWKAWKGDPKMVDYLRPQTLFGTKFESYLQHSSTKETTPFTDGL